MPQAAQHSSIQCRISHTLNLQNNNFPLWSLALVSSLPKHICKTQGIVCVNAPLMECIAWRILWFFGKGYLTVNIIKFKQFFKLMGYLFLGTMYLHSKTSFSLQLILFIICTETWELQFQAVLYKTVYRQRTEKVPGKAVNKWDKKGEQEQNKRFIMIYPMSCSKSNEIMWKMLVFASHSCFSVNTMLLFPQFPQCHFVFFPG